MEEKELRIGNIVSIYGTNGNPKGWSDIGIMPIHFTTCISKPDWFKGISLSEEWLVKFGFNKDRTDYKKDFFVFNIMFDEDMFMYFHDSLDWNSRLGNKIQYVHQLQNLYFALTGEELEIKE